MTQHKTSHKNAKFYSLRLQPGHNGCINFQDQLQPGTFEYAINHLVENNLDLNEIKKAFKEISCGKVSFPSGIKQFSNWSELSEKITLEKFSNKGFDTIILIRIEELTPRLNITFSIPFPWFGTNEANFHVK